VIRVVIEAVRGRDRLWVAVRARTIREALDAASERYPDGEVELIFPIEAESFFTAGELGLSGASLREMGEAPARIYASPRDLARGFSNAG
jgi:uncharacterized iron-regulated membrane protein